MDFCVGICPIPGGPQKFNLNVDLNMISFCLYLRVQLIKASIQNQEICLGEGIM